MLKDAREASSDAEAPTSGPSRGGTASGIFLVGLVCLMQELLHTRLLAFFLGSISNFLAIPVALLGLALGSLLVSGGGARAEDQHRTLVRLQVLVLPVEVATFAAFFAIANVFFPAIHVSLENPYEDAARLLVYAGLFLPSYALFGAIFALYFGMGAERIGRVYAYDLAGAALGCVLAPLVLTVAGLPPAIMTVLLAALGLLAVTPLPRRRLALGLGAVGCAVVALLASREVLFHERPDAARLSRYVLNDRPGATKEEVRVRWNDLARTSLIRAQGASSAAEAEAWGIVQDDGISNVKVARWDRAAKPADLLPYSLHHTLPFLMGHAPKRILVMFAGVGRDMVELDVLAEGRADITGVELNPAVVALADDPLLAGLELRGFLARPNIHLVVREGRDFLDHDRERYDLIFVATNGSINAARTGHTRKYLDTYEAMASYLDHLAPEPGAMIVFMNQPVLHKAESLRRLFAARGLGDFRRAVYAFGSPSSRGQDSLIVRPGGLTEDELAALDAKVASWPHPRTVLYAPSGIGLPHFVDVVQGRALEPLVTDDRPFVHEVAWRDFQLLPKRERFVDQLYAASWIKVLTVLLFGAVTLGVMLFLVLRPGRDRRLPWPWVGYFLLTGLSYMCLQIGLIAKTELFLGRPLYAVAVILALFLTCNGLGAYLQERLRVFQRMTALVLPAVAASLWGLLATNLCNAHLLAWPLPLKIACVAVCVGPAGTFLGMFYPFGVGRLSQAGHRATVPATYAMATLSSVWGSSWAMTALTNVGFSAVILLGAAGYALTGLLYLFTFARGARP